MQGYVKRDAQGHPQRKARLVVLNSNAGVVPGQPNASCTLIQFLPISIHTPHPTIYIIAHCHTHTPTPTGYAAAKHACDGWLGSLRVECKVWGVEVAAVCPCWHEIEIEHFDHDLFVSLPPEVQVGGWVGGWVRSRRLGWWGCVAAAVHTHTR